MKRGSLQSEKTQEMKLTGCESCRLAKGITIWRIKSLPFDAKTLEIVKSYPKLTLAGKRN